MADIIDNPNYGRLAYDAVAEIKREQISTRLSNKLKEKQVFLDNYFDAESWVINFDGVKDSLFKLQVKVFNIIKDCVINLNDTNIASISNEELFEIKLPLKEKNTLTITCSNSINIVKNCHLTLTGNIYVTNYKNPVTYMHDSLDAINAIVYQNNKYKLVELNSPQELMSKKETGTVLPDGYLHSAVKISATAPTIEDFSLLIKEDGGLKILRKSLGYDDAIFLENVEVEKACIIPMYHILFPYQILVYREGAFFSYYATLLGVIIRIVECTHVPIYEVKQLGSFHHKNGVFDINGAWYIDAKDDAHILIQRNYSRNTPSLTFHDNSECVGKADKILVYAVAKTILCVLLYQGKVTVRRFNVEPTMLSGQLRSTFIKYFDYCDDVWMVNEQLYFSFRGVITNRSDLLS